MIPESALAVAVDRLRYCGAVFRLAVLKADMFEEVDDRLRFGYLLRRVTAKLATLAPEPRP